MKKLSIIVPVYNTEKYLEKCLNSLISQTLQDIEIIVINDGSTDNSKNIIKKFKEKIIFIDNKINNGIGKTRNIGIDRALGEFIAFVDSDDFVDINLYKECYEYAITNNLDIVVFNYTKVYKNNFQEKFIIPSFKISNIEKNKELLFKINSGPCNKIYKRNLFNNKNMRFPEKLKYEDFGIIPLLIGEAKKIGYLNNYLYYYSIHDNSETTTVDNKVFDVFKVLDIVNNYYKKKNMFNEELEYLNIEKIVTYTISQRTQKNKDLINQFIDKAFIYLDNKFPNWRKNKYYNKRNILKRIIEKNKVLTKLYCKIYRVFKK